MPLVDLTDEDIVYIKAVFAAVILTGNREELLKGMAIQRLIEAKLDASVEPANAIPNRAARRAQAKSEKEGN